MIFCCRFSRKSRLNHVRFADRVKAGDRLVEHKNGRPHGEHARQADPFLLAETQVMDGPAAEGRRIGRGQGLVDALGHLGFRQTEVSGAKRHVLCHRGGEQLVGRILENHPHLAIEFGRAEGRDVAAAQTNLALLRLKQPQQDLHQRRLAGPVGAHHGYEFPRRGVEREVHEGLDPIGIGVADALDLDGVFAVGGVHHRHLSARK